MKVPSTTWYRTSHLITPPDAGTSHPSSLPSPSTTMHSQSGQYPYPYNHTIYARKYLSWVKYCFVLLVYNTSKENCDIKLNIILLSNLDLHFLHFRPPPYVDDTVQLRQMDACGVCRTPSFSSPDPFLSPPSTSRFHPTRVVSFDTPCELELSVFCFTCAVLWIFLIWLLLVLHEVCAAQGLPYLFTEFTVDDLQCPKCIISIKLASH